MAYWWVNHKKTGRLEVAGDYLWSPKVKSNGRANRFWDNMLLAQVGDIVFSFIGKVKASAGDDQTFTLGSSEIALAMELGSRKKGRRSRFILVHVKRALSSSPQPVVLPNPYGPTGTDVFRIDQADARVHYRLRT